MLGATGVFADRFGPALPTLACFVLRIGIFALVMATATPFAIGLFALLYGATFWITAPLTVVFVRDAFGLARLGTLSGTVTMVHQIGIDPAKAAEIFQKIISDQDGRAAEDES